MVGSGSRALLRGDASVRRGAPSCIRPSEPMPPTRRGASWRAGPPARNERTTDAAPVCRCSPGRRAVRRLRSVCDARSGRPDPPWPGRRSAPPPAAAVYRVRRDRAIRSRSGAGPIHPREHERARCRRSWGIPRWPLTRAWAARIGKRTVAARTRDQPGGKARRRAMVSAAARSRQEVGNRLFAAGVHRACDFPLGRPPWRPFFRVRWERAWKLSRRWLRSGGPFARGKQ